MERFEELHFDSERIDIFDLEISFYHSKYKQHYSVLKILSLDS